MNHEEIEQVHRDDMAETVRATPKRPKLTTFQQVKKVYDEMQCARIGGVLVDGTTAAAIVKLHAAISPENQQKLEAMSVTKMADTAWKLLGGKGR